VSDGPISTFAGLRVQADGLTDTVNMDVRVTTETIRALRIENDRLMQIIDAASNVLVPKADYDRVVRERDEQRGRADLAQSSCDALTRELVNARDASRARAAERACRALQRVMGTLARAAGGPGDLDAWSEARAVLAELGCVAPEVEEYRAAYERWEEGR
jgi:hypothetical protein